MFIVKVNPNGSIAWLKTRLVAKWYGQIYGVDYSDTFSSVAKMTSVWLFISMAATYNWDLHQLDIKNVFSSWRLLGGGVYGVTSKVCCSGGENEGLSSSKVFV